MIEWIWEQWHKDFRDQSSWFHLFVLLSIFTVLRVVLMYFANVYFYFKNGKKTFDVGYIAHPRVPETLFPYHAVEIKGRRPYMEDRHMVVPKLGGSDSTLFVVCDGHGGYQAAQHVVQSIKPQVESLLTANHEWKTLIDERIKLAADSKLVPAKEAAINKFSFKSILSQAFKNLDDTFLRIAEQKGLDDGTTAICAVTTKSHITVANTGDSRALLIKKDSTFEPLSIDHKPNRVEERDRITKLGGSIIHWGVWRVQGVLAVSRAIGDKVLKNFVIPDPDVVTHQLDDKDAFLVLATDGLWDVMANSDVAAVLKMCPNAQTAAECLVKSSFAKGSMDNVTTIVVDLRTQSSAESY